MDGSIFAITRNLMEAEASTSLDVTPTLRPIHWERRATLVLLFFLSRPIQDTAVSDQTGLA